MGRESEVELVRYPNWGTDDYNVKLRRRCSSSMAPRQWPPRHPGFAVNDETIGGSHRVTNNMNSVRTAKTLKSIKVFCNQGEECWSSLMSRPRAAEFSLLMITSVLLEAPCLAVKRPYYGRRHTKTVDIA